MWHRVPSDDLEKLTSISRSKKRWKEPIRIVLSCGVALCLGCASGVFIRNCYWPYRSFDWSSSDAIREVKSSIMDRAETKKSEKPRRAYAMMAYSPPESPPGDSLWGAIAMAKALHRMTRYPLILMTNTTTLPDGTDLVRKMAKLNTKVLPVNEIEIPGPLGWNFKRWDVAFWKLQVFLLTDYDKIIWLDSDAIIYRSIDWIFDLDGMWAQRDDWFCKLNQKSVCSGIISLTPSVKDFQGLLSYAAKVSSTLARGDQQLLAEYFDKVARRPVNLLADVDAAFGQCAGTAPSIHTDKNRPPTQGRWNTPAFVHKSGGWENTNENVYSSVCFSHNLTRQRYIIAHGFFKVINVCHFNPLASHWRSMFCDAVETLEITTASAKLFCNDECYYHGLHADGSPCGTGHSGLLGDAINGTTGHRDLPGFPQMFTMIGKPVLEFALDPHNQPPRRKEISPLLVRYESFSMRTWNCEDQCKHGGCCRKRHCKKACSKDQPRCSTFKFDKDFHCHLFRFTSPVFYDPGGHSGPDLLDSLLYVDARFLPTPFTIAARIRSRKNSGCQNIIAWGDGHNSWMSVEFRLSEGGELMYGESPVAGAVAGAWKEVATSDLKLADSVWHTVAVVREKSGKVSLYADGRPAARGKVSAETPHDLVPMARSARVAQSLGCVFDGDIADLRMYDSALDDHVLSGL